MTIPHIYQPPVHNGLDVHYEDDDLLIINKPPGLLTVPGKGEDKQDCLINRVKREYPEALIVHRLDMATSGLLILARNKSVQGKLGDMFQRKQIRKKYTAIVDGQVKTKQGIVSLPVITDWPNRPKQIVDFERGKHSVTHYNVISYNEDKTTGIELIPVTGRTHQLRVHMQSLGHPIVGDRLYGRDHEVRSSSRLLLHATYLEFLHPEKSHNLIFHQPADFYL